MNNLKKDLETCNQTIIDKLETLKQDSLTTKDEMKLKAELAKEEAEYNLEKFQDKAEATKDNLIRDGKVGLHHEHGTVIATANVQAAQAGDRRKQCVLHLRDIDFKKIEQLIA